MTFKVPPFLGAAVVDVAVVGAAVVLAGLTVEDATVVGAAVEELVAAADVVVAAVAAGVVGLDVDVDVVEVFDEQPTTSKVRINIVMINIEYLEDKYLVTI
jgi:hypothetical protein